MASCKADLGLPDMSVEEAARQGARTLVVGVANRGGIISEEWIEIIERALESGLDAAAGLHTRLSDVPRLAEAAGRHGRRLFDVRFPTRRFEVASGLRRPGKRLLTVGTDCSIGKMYTALAIDRELRRRGKKSDFRATGQTGIFIAGDGVSVDAVVADFISGATEWLTPANAPDHWDVVEGQGSLFHPSYAGVSLGLLHGAQPDVLVLCHEPTRPHMRGLPHYPLPDLETCLEANLAAARLTNPDVRCAGIAVNTSRLPSGEAEAYLAQVSKRLGQPAVDPLRTGVGALVDRL
jgi:uncharacterized NAD-dependent epimerase/dehydratase family protein